tara:strand:- start:577 stop:1425 length:849 start_codon:yes stop_codon:yes gene_type:complete
MTQGVLLFAYNSKNMDYTKQAIYCAKLIKEYLNKEVALVTDNEEYIQRQYPFYTKYIDHVITTGHEVDVQERVYNDGLYHSDRQRWYNTNRSSCFELTPFDETLVIDTDVLIFNDELNRCFDSKEDFLISKDYNFVDMKRDYTEFDKVSNTTCDMFWATAFYFKKTAFTNVFFDLIEHIKENWHFYRLVYEIPEVKFRNDYAFSIAIHMLRGMKDATWPLRVPASIWITVDTDILYSINETKLTLLLHKEYDYQAGTISNANVHVMNKFSLERCIDKVFADE